MKIILDTKLYTIQETADLIGTSYRTMLTHIKNGKIKGQRIGRMTYFSEEGIKDFLNARQVQEK